MAGVDSPVTQAHHVFVGEDRTLHWAGLLDTAGAILNITGYTLSWKLWDRQGGTVVVTKPGAVLNGPNGEASVTLSAADTAGLAGGMYWHDLRRTDVGFNTVLSKGTFLLQAG